MKAAISVLADRGFHSTKIRDIAQKAGVADGTIYLYFKNKDELLIQLFEEVMQRALGIFRREMDLSEAPQRQLQKFLRTHLLMVKEEPEMAQIISVVLRQSVSFIREYENPLFGEYLKLIRQILSSGVEQGEFRRDLDFTVVERAIFGAMDEISLAWLLSSRRDYPLEDSADTLSRWILRGLEPREGDNV